MSTDNTNIQLQLPKNMSTISVPTITLTQIWVLTDENGGLAVALGDGYDQGFLAYDNYADAKLAADYHITDWDYKYCVPTLAISQGLVFPNVAPPGRGKPDPDTRPLTKSP